MDTAGVGGPITGKGANVLIIDDPIKNAEEANSVVVRDKLWSWFASRLHSARTRRRGDPHDALAPGRPRRKATQADGKRWRAMGGSLLPAIAEDGDLLDRKPGQALWPERFNEEELAETKKAVSPYWWSAEYQQWPIPERARSFSGIGLVSR